MESLGRDVQEETYVLVEYAFEYTSKDGRLISIKPNERYILLRRTNDHWWHVRKSKEARPFYIPAKYVKELGPITQTVPSLNILPPTSLLGNASLQASIETGREQPPEYMYRFVSAAQEGDVDSSQHHSISSGAGMTVSFDTSGKALPLVSGAKRALPSTLSASHGSLKLPYKTGLDYSLVNCSPSTEHIRPTVSLDDLARFTPHSQAGITGSSGLCKAASWGHPHPLLKTYSENEDRVDIQEPSDKQPQEEADPDPVYVNLQDLRLEQSAATASNAESTPQPHFSSSPLTNWETHTDTESGNLFYYNPVTGQTTWESPFDASVNSRSPTQALSPAPSPATPAEWDQYVDQASGQVFFYNTATGESSWDAPQVHETPDYLEMQPAFSPYSPADRRVKEGQQFTGFWSEGINLGGANFSMEGLSSRGVWVLRITYIQR